MCSRKVEISGNLNGKMLRYLLALNGVKFFLKEDDNVQLVIYFELPINEKTVFKVQSADLTCDVIKKVAPRTDVLNLQTE